MHNYYHGFSWSKNIKQPRFHEKRTMQLTDDGRTFIFIFNSISRSVSYFCQRCLNHDIKSHLKTRKAPLSQKRDYTELGTRLETMNDNLCGKVYPHK